MVHVLVYKADESLDRAQILDLGFRMEFLTDLSAWNFFN